MKRELGLSLLFDFFSLSSCTLYHHVESKEEICVMAGNNNILFSGTSMHLAFGCCRFKFVGSRCLNAVQVHCKRLWSVYFCSVQTSSCLQI